MDTPVEIPLRDKWLILEENDIRRLDIVENEVDMYMSDTLIIAGLGYAFKTTYLHVVSFVQSASGFMNSKRCALNLQRKLSSWTPHFHHPFLIVQSV